MREELDSRIDDIFEDPSPEEGLQNRPDGRGEHVGDAGGDFDGKQSGDTDQEADDALQSRKSSAMKADSGYTEGGIRTHSH